MPRSGLFILCFCWVSMAGDEPAPRLASPSYQPEMVVNAASFLPAFAENTLVAIFGENLAWTEKWRSDEDVRGGLLPLSLPGTYINVSVNNLPASIEYASPTQVMFLMPSGLRPGPVTVWATVAGIRGPKVTIELSEYAPGLYRFSETEIMAKHAETGEFVRPEMPALAGESVVLYGTGLGATAPPQQLRTMPVEPAEILFRKEFRVLVNGEALPDEAVGYVGVMPYYPAFYEMHVKLPDPLPPDPEVRVCIRESCSQAGLKLRTSSAEIQPEEPQPAVSWSRSN